MAKLHRRASAWYGAHGDAGRAVRHRLAAGDAEDAIEMAVLACDAHMIRGQMELARQLFDRFSDEQIGGSTALMLVAGMLASFLPDPRVQRWARAALAVQAGDEPTPVGAASSRSWQLLVRAALAPDGVERMREDAALACELEQGGDPSWWCYARRLHSMALYLCGAPRRAERLLQTMLEQVSDPEERDWIHALLSLIAADQGRWDDAARSDAQIEEREHEVIQIPVVLAHVRLMAHRGAPCLAALLARAEEELTTTFSASIWRTLLSAVVLGEVSLERGDDEGAGRWTARAEALLRRYPDAGMLRGRTRRLREALEQRRLSEPLTQAERRVLELLPTQLTAAQIAARLFVSTNTVKTHMRRVYAKLDANTRTEAVERSRELGLLGPPNGA